MRLLMTTDTVGGVWTFTSELTRQLLQRGHAVHLVSFGRKPSPEQQAWADHLLASHTPDLSTEGALDIERPRSPASLPCTASGAPPFTYTGSDLPLEWMQNNEDVFEAGQAVLLNLLQRHPFDLILTNQFCFGRLDTAVPRIVVAHSDVLSWARACNPSTLEGSPWLNRYTSLVQGGLLSAMAVATPTAAMGRALKASFFLPANYVVIPNGVTPEVTADPAPVRKLQAITAGRLWDPAKGLDILRHLAAPMPLLIAGDHHLEQPAQDAGWPAHLNDLGPLSRSALHQRFRESAIYLCTSRYEPFGLAPLEAALCGCAVVARDLPSLREVWEDNALYFTDEPSLQQTLQALATNHELLAEAQRRAHARASQFTPERMTDAYLHLFGVVSRLASQAPSHVA